MSHHEQSKPEQNRPTFEGLKRACEGRGNQPSILKKKKKKLQK